MGKKIVWRIIKLVTQVHTLLYRLTVGGVGGLASGTPVLILTTTGRKSGRKIAVPLLFLPHGDSIVLVASKGGDPNDPHWWKNLQAHPEASVQVGQHHWKMVASQASPELKGELWPVLCRYYPPYQTYQDKTDRDIPVVILKHA